MTAGLLREGGARRPAIFSMPLKYPLTWLDFVRIVMDQDRHALLVTSKDTSPFSNTHQGEPERNLSRNALYQTPLPGPPVPMLS